MPKMPVLFAGHGSPMNAIEDNRFTRGWKEITARMPKPEAVISFSAHWFTKGTKIMGEKSAKTVYDMYGFPRKLYKVVYAPPGNPELAGTVKELISAKTEYDNSWGIDHGTWSVLHHMYPEADIPVFQISIDGYAPPEAHYRIGEELKALRERGVLLFGTGNIVHNLRILDWNMSEGGYGWAERFDGYIKDNILTGKHDNIVGYKDLGDISRLAIPTPDHFYPLLYVLGAADKADKITVFNEGSVMGSVSMTSYLFE